VDTRIAVFVAWKPKLEVLIGIPTKNPAPPFGSGAGFLVSFMTGIN